jgi:hypothetical protein
MSCHVPERPGPHKRLPAVGSALGLSGSARPSPAQVLTIELDEPFRLDLTVWALRRRAHNAIDRWDASTYQRTLSLAGGVMALSVTQDGASDPPGLLVSFAGMPADGSAELLARDAAHTLLGLNVDVSVFAAMAAHDPLLGPLAVRMRGLRPPRFPTVLVARWHPYAGLVYFHLLLDSLSEAGLVAQTRQAG